MTSDTPNRAEQMFPRLTAAQIDRILNVGQRRDVTAGEILFDVGDQNTRFFVVLSGAVQLLRPMGAPCNWSTAPWPSCELVIGGVHE